METKKNDFFDVLAIFAKHGKFILIFTLITAAAVVIFSLVTPQIWSSTATFFTIGDQNQSLPINLGELSSLASSFLSTQNFVNGQNSIAIMNSRTFSEDVIRKFNLIPYFKIKEKDSLRAMDLALKKLSKKVVRMGLDDETGLITVRIETKKKELSKQIAEYYVQRLELYNQDYKLTQGKLNRQFLEKRVAEVRNQIDSLSFAMKNFQEKNRAIDIQTQMTSIITLYSDIISQQINNDIELEIAKNTYSQNSPVVKELEQKKRIIQDKIKELEGSAAGLKPKYIIDIDNIPDVSLQYAQLMLNLEIQKKVFEFIYPQYEAARIEELKDMPTLEIVDHPREAGLRAKPKRALLCIVTTLIGFAVSLILALLDEILKKNSARMHELRKIIFSKG
ncbi:MAG TPA: Wzz/FepE/Etk N-terminal domain-containing protein [Candidatus Cloacimonadota bacterium]|nr:Wzz/FepE/Etk N-terminal domain-containing protein [Candidatus Cloacimonadota bacterium]HOV17179.1 Wzz/FepE/Etk N-terminal domain-containing protein [Candidatus Cloacimonadota bacterium]HQL15450.1 Wzz/FepE/Etk N-terminal domain-containing protein [Candidatus Cloacimonadota bacterium]